MFHAREVAEAFTDILFLDTSHVGGDTCSQRVVDIMDTCQAEAFLFHIERLWFLNLVLTFLYVTDDTVLLQFGEWVLDGFDVVFFQFTFDDGVISPIDESVLRGLVLDDAHLGIYVILHLETIAVQMVWRNVQEDGDVGAEVIHIVELE